MVPKNQNGDVLVTKESKADPGRDYDWLQLPNKKISNALRAEFDNVRNGVSTCLIESPLGPENPKRFYDLALIPGI
jgi:hypothetical protein